MNKKICRFCKRIDYPNKYLNHLNSAHKNASSKLRQINQLCKKIDNEQKLDEITEYLKKL